MAGLWDVLWSRMEEKKDTMLVTVVEKRGSAPRAQGAYMLVGEQGRIAGTIGGGASEYNAVCYAETLLAEKRCDMRWYNLNEADVAALGMVCGGSIRVLFYYVEGQSDAQAEWVRNARTLEAEHRPYWLLLPIGQGLAQVWESGSEPSGCGNQKITAQNGEEWYAEQFQTDGIVYIFGAGHLAQALTPILSMVSFRCVVADDREDLLRPEWFAGAEELRLISFGEPEKSFHITKNDYLVVVTRGHEYDYEVERFALKTNAKYIGVVGSRRKTMFVNEKLLAAGITREELARVTTPIGLAIGSKTPAEIAVSIAAQLIQVRAGSVSLNQE